MYAESGFVRAIAYNVVFIAGVSTLLFNGNPLLRFDAYYVLADFLEIPNLGQRSTQYWGYLAKRYLFAMDDVASPAHDRRERWWLALYGAASYAYRIFISITIILFISGFYFALGVMLAVWTVVGVWAWPLAKTVSKPFREPAFHEAKRSPGWVMGGLAALLALLFFVIPAPLTTTVEGAVSGAENNRIVVGERCLIDEVLVTDRAEVQTGEALLTCNSRLLDARMQVLDAQLSEVRARQLQAFSEPVQLKLLGEEGVQLEQEKQDLLERIARLTVRAPGEGVLTMPRFSDLPGRFAERGETIGWVVGGPLRIQAMVPEADAELVREGARTAALRFAGNYQQVIEVDHWSMSPGATRELLAPVLSQAGGGSIAVAPNDDEPETVQNYFLTEVRLALSDPHPQRIGERVYVRFEHAPEPIGYRLYRLVRRTFLAYFDV
jgi:putative peptide zinc metalloprotease protein